MKQTHTRWRTCHLSPVWLKHSRYTSVAILTAACLEKHFTVCFLYLHVADGWSLKQPAGQSTDCQEVFTVKLSYASESSWLTHKTENWPDSISQSQSSIRTRTNLIRWCSQNKNFNLAPFKNHNSSPARPPGGKRQSIITCLPPERSITDNLQQTESLTGSLISDWTWPLTFSGCMQKHDFVF